LLGVFAAIVRLSPIAVPRNPEAQDKDHNQIKPKVSSASLRIPFCVNLVSPHELGIVWYLLVGLLRSLGRISVRHIVIAVGRLL
jgi:hypothetical protein